MENEVLFAAWGEIKSTQPYNKRIKKLNFKKKGKGHIKATIFGKGMKFPAMVLGGEKNAQVEVYSCTKESLEKEMKNQRVGVKQVSRKVSVVMNKGKTYHNVIIFVSNYKPLQEGMIEVDYFNDEYVWNDKQKGPNVPKYMKGRVQQSKPKRKISSKGRKERDV